MNDTDIAYIAGIVDGEGYIGIKKTAKLRNGRVNPCYQEKIQIRMVDEPAIKFLADTLGGNYYAEGHPVPNRRRLFCYQATDRVAVQIIETIFPYLRVKKSVAEIVLKLRDIRTNPIKIPVKIAMLNRWGKTTEFTRYRFSEEHIAICDSLWTECKNINKGI